MSIGEVFLGQVMVVGCYQLESKLVAFFGLYRFWFGVDVL